MSLITIGCGVSSDLSDALSAFDDMIHDIINGILDITGAVADAIGSIFNDIWGALGKMLPDLSGLIPDISFSAAVEALFDLIEGTLEYAAKLAEIVLQFGRAILDAGLNIFDMIADALSAFLKGLNPCSALEKDFSIIDGAATEVAPAISCSTIGAVGEFPAGKNVYEKAEKSTEGIKGTIGTDAQGRGFGYIPADAGIKADGPRLGTRDTRITSEGTGLQSKVETGGTVGTGKTFTTSGGTLGTTDTRTTSSSLQSANQASLNPSTGLGTSTNIRNLSTSGTTSASSGSAEPNLYGGTFGTSPQTKSGGPGLQSIPSQQYEPGGIDATGGLDPTSPNYTSTQISSTRANPNVISDPDQITYSKPKPITQVSPKKNVYGKVTSPNVITEPPTYSQPASIVNKDIEIPKKVENTIEPIVLKEIEAPPVLTAPTDTLDKPVRRKVVKDTYTNILDRAEYLPAEAIEQARTPVGLRKTFEDGSLIRFPDEADLTNKAGVDKWFEYFDSLTKPQQDFVDPPKYSS